MTVPTPPAVSEAMREAVFRALRDPMYFSRLPASVVRRQADFLIAGPIASEIARLTGENARLDHNCQEWVRQAAENAEAADRLARRAETAEAETARLRAGIQAIIDGNYDHPRRHRPGQCRHGIHYYDECGNCTDEALAALLSSQEKTDA